MKINRLMVSHYKNLVDCEIQPRGLHAITGWNSTGKSNLIEVMQVLAALLSTSEEGRASILKAGLSPTGVRWFPMTSEQQYRKAFEFEIDCELNVNAESWEIFYVLRLEAPEYENAYQVIGSGKIAFESLIVRKIGSRGRKKVLLQRELSGKTVAKVTGKSRITKRFVTASDMSALRALEIREPNTFEKQFSVMAAFRKSLVNTIVLKMNPYKLVAATNPRSREKYEFLPGETVDTVSLYDQLLEIKKIPRDWKRLQHWLSVLCGFQDIDVKESSELTLKNQKSQALRFVFITTQNRLLLPDELSTGAAIILGLLTALFSFSKTDSPIFIEEPETFLHPKAAIDFLTLLREFSNNRTIIFTTHSSVLINSMKPEEVTLMVPIKTDGFFKTIDVSGVQEAMEVLERGYISFGDLLQNNFNV